VTELASDSRARILDAALALMSERGVSGTSMRRLASDSGLNVATLYHYFPSKADLLAAVIDERGLFERLRTEGPPPPPEGLDAAGRARWLVRWLWDMASTEEVVWRLLIGESMRGEAQARATSSAILAGLHEAFAGWVADAVPELADRAGLVARSAVALLLALVVEHLAVGPDPDRVRARIDDLVALLDPDRSPALEA
jgi:AcrR family transcriptional regulator